MYKCEICNKEFQNNFTLNRHKNRKNPCSINDKFINNDSLTCQACKKVFSSKRTLINHVRNSCKLISTFNPDIVNNIINNNTQNINQNILNNVNMNQIKLIKFGEEDLSFIKDDVYTKILNAGFKSVPNLIEQIHFNPHNPDNQNIYISNMKNTFVLVYDGEKWEVKDRDDVIEELMYSKTDHLLEKFDDLVSELPDSAIKKFQRFIDKKDDDKVVEKIKKDIKMILYNNRQLPMNIRKEFDLLRINKNEEEEKEEKKNLLINSIDDIDDDIIDKMLDLLNKNKIKN